MIIDGIKPARQYNNIFSYTTAGLILTYLQESNLPEDNEGNNMLIDDNKIEKQIEIHKKRYTKQRYD
jgi:hypothetical protein